MFMAQWSKFWSSAFTTQVAYVDLHLHACFLYLVRTTTVFQILQGRLWAALHRLGCRGLLTCVRMAGQTLPPCAEYTAGAQRRATSGLYLPHWLHKLELRRSHLAFRERIV